MAMVELLTSPSIFNIIFANIEMNYKPYEKNDTVG